MAQAVLSRVLTMISLAAILGLGEGCRTKGPEPIANFMAVDALANIYRGGQPSKEGFDHLRALGITRIIKLNTESEGSDLYAENIGMEVLKFPITFWEQVGTEPWLGSIKFAASVIQPNTFIHCQHGQDRTGIVVAEYQCQHGMKREEAYRDMIAKGFHPALFGLTKAWEDLK